MKEKEAKELLDNLSKEGRLIHLMEDNYNTRYSIAVDLVGNYLSIYDMWEKDCLEISLPVAQIETMEVVNNDIFINTYIRVAL